MNIEKSWSSSSVVVVGLALIGLLTLVGYPIHFEDSNYWEYHGVFFLISVTLFPRLTLLFSSVPFGGFGWWLGFFFAPRILVAVLATIHFWKNNPVLVVISWVVALSGETNEKRVITKKYTRRETVVIDDDVIEADYEIKS